MVIAGFEFMNWVEQHGRYPFMKSKAVSTPTGIIEQASSSDDQIESVSDAKAPMQEKKEAVSEIALV